MSNTDARQTKLRAVLGSSNFKTDVVTIVLGGIAGIVGFFYALPDLNAAAAIGSDVGDLIAQVKAGAWASVFTAALKIYNVISHMLKD